MKSLELTKRLGWRPQTSSHNQETKIDSVARWAQVVALALVVPSATIGAQTFRVGAGAADIQIPASMFPVAEFTGQHDPVSTRVLLLENGSQQIAILTVDTPSIQDQSITCWKVILTRTIGIKPENALVIGTHTTPAPHVSSEGRPGGAPGAGPRSGGGPGAGQAVGGPGGAGTGGPGGPGGAGPGGPGGPGVGSASAKAYSQAVDNAVQAAATKALAN